MIKARIIVVDDDRDYLEILRIKLLAAGFSNLQIEDNPVRAAERFDNGECYDIALIDMHMPEMDGIALLTRLKSISFTTECIMVTAVDQARMAVTCLRTGAYDYLVKPVAQDDLRVSINRALEHKRLMDIVDIGKQATPPALHDAKPFEPIATRSDKILRILKEAELHAASDVPILITGESGTGKGLLAKAIHDASPRAKHPFTPVNMASLSPGLFDAEFFGHTRGAFTGAEKNRAGYIEVSDHGTLFLDEIGILPLDLQGKLLRVLQDGEYAKIGSSQQHSADVRFITATNADLDALMARRLFRQDLYYRIRGGWLHLPPLRERREDITLLVLNLLQKSQTRQGSAPISEEALVLLQAYNYPGNIRELQSIVQSAQNLAQGQPIRPRHLPAQFRTRHPPAPNSLCDPTQPILPLAEIERRYILKTYVQLNRNKAKTARSLGIGLNTLRRKLETYQDHRPPSKGPC